MLARDLRALTPEDILKQAQAVTLAPDIRILEKSNVSELLSFDEIVITEDEVGDELRKKYFADRNVTVDTAFIRWNAVKAFSKDIPESELTISQEELDRQFMSEARAEAKKSSDWWRQVGSVVAKDGKILLSGCNKHMPSEQSPNIDGDPRSNFDAGTHLDLFTAIHGEAGLIAEAARKGLSLEGASIYVTTFPCPNCAMLITKAGIKKVYYADGYSLLNAQETFKQSGIQTVKVV